ncbi:MAG: AI-2E family transporter, partial [Betaproteobacteria bacterium]
MLRPHFFAHMVSFMDRALRGIRSAKSDAGAAGSAPTGSPSEAFAAQLPANPRTVALTLIAIMLTLFLLRSAAAFFIPLLLSLALSYALSPAVRRLSTWGVPRWLAALLVILVVVSLIAGAIWRVGNDAGDVLQQLPDAVQRLRVAIANAGIDHGGALEHVQRAATELEKLADAATPPANKAKASLAAPAAIDVRSMLLIGTGSVVVALGQLASGLFLAFFLLSAGKMFRRKFIQVVGPSTARRKTALRVLERVDQINQRYFVVIFLTNLCIGVGIGIGFYAMGLERPAVWGIAAAILHTIPYLGTAIIAGAAALTAFGQFGTAGAAFLAAGIALSVGGVFGVVLQPWFLGRAARMNAAAVFVSLL